MGSLVASAVLHDGNTSQPIEQRNMTRKRCVSWQDSSSNNIQQAETKQPVDCNLSLNRDSAE